MQIDIRIDGWEALVADLKGFAAATKRAMRSAVDTTATAVKNISIDEAERVYNIKRTRLTKDTKGNPTIYVKRSTQSEVSATVSFKGGQNAKAGDRPGLQNYATNRPPANHTRGWMPTYTIKRGGTSRSIERGFYGEGKLKGQGIFQRQLDSKKIVRRTGLGIKQIIEQKEIIQVVERRGSIIFRERIMSAVDAQLAKMKAKG